MGFPRDAGSGTKQALEAAGYVFDNEARCRGCGASIEWWITPNGKKMPMTVVEVKDGEGFFAKVIGYERKPHFMDCPEVESFRRK